MLERLELQFQTHDLFLITESLRLLSFCFLLLQN